jgi:hypothetical protein
MRHILRFGLVFILGMFIACPMPWEEEEEEEQAPAPPTILGHEFESHEDTNNEKVNIRITAVRL